MKRVDITQIDSVLREVAATEIMPRFRKLAAGDVEMKGVNDPVTVADKAAETVLSVRLIDLLPGSVVVGEESFAINPNITAYFEGDSPVWVIDPIDGTRNFVDGKPEFGTMLALVHNKKTLAAWIHDPNSGDTLAAEQGSGVWLGSHRMRLAGQDPATPKIGIIGSRLKKFLKEKWNTDVLSPLPKLEIGSAAAFDYARLFTGDSVFANSTESRASYLVYLQSKCWDHLPGLFLLQEAEGYAATFREKPYDMTQDMSGLLISPDRAAWEAFFAVFRPAVESMFLS